MATSRDDFSVHRSTLPRIFKHVVCDACRVCVPACRLESGFKPTTGDRRPKTRRGEASLRDYQFPAMLLFKFHGLVERDDRALDLVVGGRLGCDSLQPKAGSGHKGEQRATMFGGETNNFV